MLLQEKMKNTKFSPSEEIVIDFILTKQERIKDYSTTMIAGETYTSPSLLVRISKKLGFSGYNNFKNAFLEEVQYLHKSHLNIDANQPFLKTDSIMNIANKITQLKTESLNDTLSLIHHDTLQKAVRALQKSNTVKVFGVSNLSFPAEEFVFKLRHIGKNAEVFVLNSNIYQEAMMANSNDLGICLSYSGESGEIIKIANILMKKNVPIIAITSIGENSLTRLADIVLRVTTREKSYSKIGAYSSLESISLILDVLYSCFFTTAYDQHYTFKTELAKNTESREITNLIIQENEQNEKE